MFCVLRPQKSAADLLESRSINTRNVRPMSRWLFWSDNTFCIRMTSFRRRFFTSSGMSSAYLRAASVPGRSESKHIGHGIARPFHNRQGILMLFLGFCTKTRDDVTRNGRIRQDAPDTPSGQCTIPGRRCGSSAFQHPGIARSPASGCICRYSRGPPWWTACRSCLSGDWY